MLQDAYALINVKSKKYHSPLKKKKKKKLPNSKSPGKLSFNLVERCQRLS